MSEPSAAVDRFRVAKTLRDIATLLALSGAPAFKARAYRTGAAALEALSADLGQLVEEGRLEEIPGVGPRLASQIAEIWFTGRSSTLERLASELPPGSLELAGVRGLTVRRLRALYDAFGPLSLGEIMNACAEQRVRKVPGFGAKTEQQMLEAIRNHLTRAVRVLSRDGERLAETLSAYLRASPVFLEVRAAGELRRAFETIGELLLVASVSDATLALEHFARFPSLAEVADSRDRGRLATGLPVRLVTTDLEHFAAELLRHTGPDDHVAEIEARAGALVGSSETELYRRAGVCLVPPEIRDLPGVLDAPPRPLITDQDVRGFVHCHTVYSDGRHTIEEMARAAEKLGAGYITITDHSESAHYAGGLTLDRLERQWDEIARVQEQVSVRVLRGIESDILADGALDYPDHVLERFDVIIASIHSRMRMDEDEMTRRLLRTMRLPLFKIWGHPLARLVLRRPPVACRVEEILDAVAESPAAIEVNGDPHRLDLEPRWIRSARERGIRFVISTDAHSSAQLSYVEHAVRIARRGGLGPSEVLNTAEAEAFAAWVRPTGAQPPRGVDDSVLHSSG